MTIKFMKARWLTYMRCSAWFVCFFCALASESERALAGENPVTNFMPYYPVNTGLAWEYQVTENNILFSQQVECSVISDSRFILHTKSKRQTRYFFKIDDGLVKLVQIKAHFSCLPSDYTVAVKPALPVFSLLGKIGDRWQWSGRFRSFFKTKKASIETKIEGFDQLIVNDKSITCLEIVTEIMMDGEADTLVAYYGRGIGLIKQLSKRQKKELTHFERSEKIREVALLKTTPSQCERVNAHLQPQTGP